ncbi:multidrug ABC transporter permease/ATP-binding protein [Psychrobacter sanguinis]|uniref:Multidrug ABC transporter permease/ATP-binding protein n=1 Tax=Psychrobacter sanguinis TaxID=861445 RepID=A0A844M2Y3_9GAMM|nr:multidrug ABC transporter permease/ATP-binding protein [Psychrobacter sanguinis]MUG33154.1 multidrug ABC transporter permease/ATP-binding protein [Psychrobacter sanguinis]
MSAISPPPTSSLYTLIWTQYRLGFVKVIVLNLINAAVSVGIIAYINHTFLSGQIFEALSWQSFAQFLAMVLLLLLTSFASQYALTCLGHQFVYKLRTQLVKQILDTPVAQVDNLGSARLMASLSTDIQALTTAFVRMPELVQGIILAVAVSLYLGSLSWPLLLIIMLWIALTIWISTLLVKHVYQNLTHIRDINDALYQDYQSVIEGRKELALNQQRAKQLYTQDLVGHAKAYKKTIIKADTYHLSAVNWSNIMMFAAIGVIFAVASYLGLSLGVATTFALTLLFMQSPILHTVGAYPTLQTAQVALDKIQSLQLAEYQPEFISPTANKAWQTLTLRNIDYQYSSQDLILKQVNLTLNKGDVVFLIGSNGSGKSTLAKVLTGIFAPTSGEMTLDGRLITEANRTQYRQLFSAIFSDQHIFKQLIGKDGNAVDMDLVQHWQHRLQLQNKVSIDGDKLSTDKLSQGQRKRLAMLTTVAEQKDILLLDEWAADQDPAFRRVFYQHLIPELKALGKTLFIISHDDSYFEHADRLLLMKQGKLVELDPEQRKQASTDAISML